MGQFNVQESVRLAATSRRYPGRSAPQILDKSENREKPSSEKEVLALPLQANAEWDFRMA